MDVACYTNRSDVEEFAKDLGRLGNEEAARNVFTIIDDLCKEGVPIAKDRMSQWLGILAKTDIPDAMKRRGTEDVIEIYPSGTKGLGREDRILFQVGETQVKIILVYISDHK